MPILDIENEQALAKYQRFVRQNDRGQVTQDPLWGELKANWNHLYVYHENSQGDIDGVFSLLTIEAVPGGTLAYAARGPIADLNDVDLIQTMIDEAIDHLPENTFLIRMDPEVSYSQALNDLYAERGFVLRNEQITSMHGNIQPRKNVVLRYDGEQPITNEEELMLHFKRDYRNQIRRAAKDGVVVTWGTDELQIDEFFDLYVKMANAQGITYRPKSYFDRMRELFAETDLFRVYVAHLEGQPIAAGIGFSYGDEIWYMYAGSDRAYTKHYAPYAVQWEMLKWGLETGKAEYDFGGVGDFVPEDGLYKFKHGFAYSDEPAIYIGEIDKVLNAEKYAEYLEQFK